MSKQPRTRRSRSPYAHLEGNRRCAAGHVYVPAVSGCPVCRAVAHRYRKVKMLPAHRRCRACKKQITGLRHHNQHLHPECRATWDEQRDDRKGGRLREKWKAAKTPVTCRIAACKKPRAGAGTTCEYHLKLRRRQYATAR